MSSIDDRVVQMKFDNSQFQKGVADTNKSLADLKQGLNLDGAAKSLQGLDSAGKQFSLAGMAAGVDAIASKFSALSVMGITALVNISNQAINTGINLVKSLTIGPIADGFSDYNEKLTSVQTIMNATGASIEEVSGYFGQLDTYADKTIYNLKDMTGAFAKFTNAGVGMDKSVPAIKGIANMVALAGQDAGAASIAMYNLSQSIAGGFLTTIDYKSLNLANVATKEWKDQMIAGAVAAGTLEKTAEGTYHILGTKAGAASSDTELFTDSLKDGWATTEVLMKVLGDYGDTQTEIGKKAQAAAQDVKSFGMMMDTLKAGVGTGWTDTFEILVGNITEAKALFTPLTATIGGFFEEMGTARNTLLADWKVLGGRETLIEGLKFAFDGLFRIIGPIREAFTDLFPPTTAKQLVDMTVAFRDFMGKFKLGAEGSAALKSTFRGLFAVLDIGWLIIQKLFGVFARLFKTTEGAGTGILKVTGNFGEFLVKVRDTLRNGEKLNAFFTRVGDVLVKGVDKLKEFARWLGTIGDKIAGFFQNFKGIDTSGLTNAVDGFKASFNPLQTMGENLRKLWDGLINIFGKAMDIGKVLASKLKESMGGFGTFVSDGLREGFNPETIIALLGTGLLAGIARLIKKIYDTIKKAKEGGDGPGFLQSIKDAFGALTDTLAQMQQTLKASTLLLIAAAIALLTISVVALSKIDPAKLGAALAAISVMFVQLAGAMAVLDKMNVTASATKLAILGVAMILLAISIRILASAVEKMSGLGWEELAKGLVGVIALLGGIAGAMRLMPKNPTGMIGTGIGMIALAVGIKILASAVGDFAAMDWQKMMQGLIGVGIVLGGLGVFSRIVNPSQMVSMGVSLVIIAASMKIFASAINDLGNIDWQKMMQGLIAMGMLLGGLAIFSRVVNPSQMMTMGVSLVIIAASMKIFASAISDLGNIDWQKMMQGLIAMGMMLGGLAIFSRVVNPAQMITMGVSLILIAVALKMLAEVVKGLGGMSWEEIGKGLTVLGGSLLILAGAMYLMSGALVGALALLVVVGALTLLVPVLQSLGNMSWEQIGTGLGALAATLGVLAVAGLVLGVLSPLFAAFGISLILVGTGALLAGLGLLAFSVGITALALAGAVGTTALVAMVMALAALIPAVMVQVGIGLVAFAQVIIDSAPKFGEAIMAVLNTLLDIIVIMSPKIVETLWGLIVLLVETVVRGIPYLVDAGMRLIIGILNGIGNNIGQVIDAGANLVVEFLNGLGRNAGKVTDAAAKMIVDFVNGLANSIRNNQKQMEEAGGNLAGAIIDGMTGGLASKAQSVINGAMDLGKKAIDGIANALNSHSPSKETFKLGEYAGDGLSLGMANRTSMVEKAAGNIGKAAISTLKDTLSNLSTAVSGDMDVRPTISPVLDLTDVRNGAKLIDGMIKPQSLTVDSTYAKASYLSASARTSQEDTIERADSIAASNEKITLIQNNFSPKALSEAEIYRGTKNQLSRAKEELNK